MKVEMSVPEVVEIFKEIQEQPEKLFDMIRVEIRENVGEYLSKLMDMELTHFLGRERYEHGQGEVNHRNGSYVVTSLLKELEGSRLRYQETGKASFQPRSSPEVNGMRMSFGKI